MGRKIPSIVGSVFVGDEKVIEGVAKVVCDLNEADRTVLRDKIEEGMEDPKFTEAVARLVVAIFGF